MNKVKKEKFDHDELFIDDVDGWCAARKVSLEDWYFTDLHFEPPTNVGILKEVGRQGGSIACVSVNVDEKEVIAFLKRNKWVESPRWPNYLHGGRKTFMAFKQVPKRYYNGH